MDAVNNPVILVALTVLIAFSNGSESSDQDTDSANMQNVIDQFDLSEVLVSANASNCTSDSVSEYIAPTVSDANTSGFNIDLSDCQIQLNTIE